MLDEEIVGVVNINFYGQIPDITVQKEGYSFESWVYNGKEYREENYLDIFGNEIIMSAKMMANDYKVFLEGYGIVITKYAMLIPAGNYKIEKPGYTFLGWEDEEGTLYINEKGVPCRSWYYAGDKTLYSKWMVITYYITYNLNGGEATLLTSTNPTKYTPSFTVVMLQKPTTYLIK